MNKMELLHGECMLYADGIGLYLDDNVLYCIRNPAKDRDYIHPSLPQLTSLTPLQKQVAIRWVLGHSADPEFNLREYLEQAVVHCDIPWESVIVAKGNIVIYQVNNICFLGYISESHTPYIRNREYSEESTSKLCGVMIGMVRRKQTPYTIGSVTQLISRKAGDLGIGKAGTRSPGDTRANFIIGALPNEIYVDYVARRITIPVLLNSHFTPKEQRERVGTTRKEIAEVARKSVRSDMRSGYYRMLRRCRVLKYVMSMPNVVDVVFEEVG